jgi:hypothetical protein
VSNQFLPKGASMLTIGTTSKKVASKMNTNRKTAIIAGLLFIIATLAPILSGIFLVPLQHATDLLSHVATHEQQVILGVFLELVMITAIVAIPVLLLSVLKKYDETLALGYLIKHHLSFTTCLARDGFCSVVDCKRFQLVCTSESVKAGRAVARAARGRLGDHNGNDTH